MRRIVALKNILKLNNMGFLDIISNRQDQGKDQVKIEQARVDTPASVTNMRLYHPWLYDKEEKPVSDSASESSASYDQYWIDDYKKRYSNSGRSTSTTGPTSATTSSISSSSDVPAWRNNNPLNIIYNSNNNWQGQVGADGRWAKFDTRANGYRAAFKLMKNKIQQGYNTLSALISQWAPAGDGNNNPTRYAQRVATKVGIKTTDKLDPNNGELLQKIALAMAEVEAGKAKNNDAADARIGWEALT